MSLPRMMGFAPDPPSVRAARKYVAAFASGAHVHVEDDARLVISELMTNAIAATARYAEDLRRLGAPVPEAAEIWVIVASLPHVLMVGVENLGYQLPVEQEPDESAETGRGLLITQACTTLWDSTVLTDGVGGHSVLVYAALEEETLPHRRPHARKLTPETVKSTLLGLRALRVRIPSQRAPVGAVA